MQRLLIVLASMLLLQGCITSVVTVPVKIVYKTTKGVVKGTAAVVRAVTPDDDDDDKDKSKDQEKQKDREQD